MDKDSGEYFMCYMTQKEFEEKTKGHEIKPIVFNRIRPERSKREDMEGPSHLPDKGWPDKNEGFP